MQVSISYIDPMGMKVVVDLWFEVLSYFHPDCLRKMNHGTSWVSLIPLAPLCLVGFYM